MDKNQQGVRHFGVVLPSLSEFKDLVTRIIASEYQWISEPEKQSDAKLSGKIGGKLADPSGNVIEIKYYENENDYLN
jgi:extradiol dioxygenase family protein